jgi:hypothetical protein
MGMRKRQFEKRYQEWEMGAEMGGRAVWVRKKMGGIDGGRYRSGGFDGWARCYR